VRRTLLIVSAVYFLAAGVFLLFAPWTSRWEVNRFFSGAPGLREVMLHGSSRVAVSILGALLVIIGFSETLRVASSPPAPGPVPEANPPGESEVTGGGGPPRSGARDPA